MPKNKNKPNAFYFFMLDWKQQEEKKGRKFVNGLRDVQVDPQCSIAWKVTLNKITFFLSCRFYL